MQLKKYKKQAVQKFSIDIIILYLCSVEEILRGQNRIKRPEMSYMKATYTIHTYYIIYIPIVLSGSQK